MIYCSIKYINIHIFCEILIPVTRRLPLLWALRTGTVWPSSGMTYPHDGACARTFSGSLAFQRTRRPAALPERSHDKALQAGSPPERELHVAEDLETVQAAMDEMALRDPQSQGQ